MDYEYYYNNSRNRYYNACSEISGCQSRLSSLNTQRQNMIHTINQLNIQIEREQTALEAMEQMAKGEGSLQQKIAVVSDKTGQAAANYVSMVDLSDAVSKDLTVVYGEEFSNTKGILDNVLNLLRTKITHLGNSINDLRNQLNSANAQLQDIDSQIRGTEANLYSWENTRRNAANDMEYYRRKMQAANYG